MTEASQLTKPRPTQQTAAGSPPYTNKLLQALAVTFQVSFFHLSQVKEYLSFYISMNINSYSGWPFPVCWPPISRLLCLPLLHRLLHGITLLPLLVFLGLSHPYKWREKWALGQLDEVNNHVLLQHQVSPLAHMRTKSFLKGLGLYGSTTRPTTLFLWSRPLSWTPRRIISSPAILMAYFALELWYVNLI